MNCADLVLVDGYALLVTVRSGAPVGPGAGPADDSSAFDWDALTDLAVGR